MGGLCLSPHPPAEVAGGWPKPGGTTARLPPVAEVWGEHQPRCLIPPGSRAYEGGEKANLALPLGANRELPPFRTRDRPQR